MPVETSVAAAAMSAGGGPHGAVGPPGPGLVATSARDQPVMLLRPFTVLPSCL